MRDTDLLFFVTQTDYSDLSIKKCNGSTIYSDKRVLMLFPLHFPTNFFHVRLYSLNLVK